MMNTQNSRPTLTQVDFVVVSKFDPTDMIMGSPRVGMGIGVGSSSNSVASSMASSMSPSAAALAMASPPPPLVSQSVPNLREVWQGAQQPGFKAGPTPRAPQLYDSPVSVPHPHSNPYDVVRSAHAPFGGMGMGMGIGMGGTTGVGGSGQGAPVMAKNSSYPYLTRKNMQGAQVVAKARQRAHEVTRMQAQQMQQRERQSMRLLCLGE